MMRFTLSPRFFRLFAVCGLLLAAATLRAQVGVPTLAQPADNATGVPAATTFIWRPASGVVAYEVQIAFDLLFDQLSYQNSTADSQHEVEDLWPDTLYYWRVRAVDSLDSAGAWSAVRSFRTVATGAPRPLTPVDGAGDLPYDQVTVTYAHPTTPPNGFDVGYAFDPDFRGGVTVSASGTAASLPTLPADTAVYWRVRVAATAGAGAGPWSRTMQFHTARPSLPRLGSCSPLTPTSGITLEDVLISSLWSGPSGGAAPVLYHVQFSQDPTMRTVALDFRDLDSTALSLTLPAAGDWHWRVRALATTEGLLDGPWSSAASFTVNERVATALDAPVLLLPPNGARWRGLTVTMSWDSVAGGESYEVEVGRDTLFEEADTVIAGSAHSARLAGLQPDTLYTWRARALAAGGANRGPWSRPFTFSTRSLDTVLPGVPVPVAPENERRDLETTVQFHWNPARAASAHVVQVCGDSLFGEGTREFGAFDSTATAALEEGGRWWWRVRGVNEFGPGAWSAVYTFTTATTSSVPVRADDVPRSIAVTPTPAVSSAQLLARLAPFAEGRVTVAGLRGGIVFDGSFRANAEGTVQIDLPVAALQSGLYRCRVASTAGEVLETPLVVAR